MESIQGWRLMFSIFCHRTLREWMQNTFTTENLRHSRTWIVNETINRSWSPFIPGYSQEQCRTRGVSIDRLVCLLYRKYLGEMLGVLVAPFYREADPDHFTRDYAEGQERVVLNWLECYGRLWRAREVHDERSLKEFIVRNAMAIISTELLIGRDFVWGVDNVETEEIAFGEAE